MNTITRHFDNFLDGVQAMLMSLLVKLGPFAVALMPALFTAYAIYHTFAPEAGSELALLFASIVGLAMETVGIVATHTAIDLYNGKEQGYINPGKYRLMVWLVPIYVVGVASVVYFSEDAFSPLVRGLGVASPLLTCIVYIAVALARDLSNIKAGQVVKEEKQDNFKADEIRWKREMERLEMEMKHNERLAKIEAKSVQRASNLDAQTSNLETREERLDAALEFMRQKPDASYAEIGRHIGMTKSSGENYAKALMDAGLVHRNGNGWTVLQ